MKFTRIERAIKQCKDHLRDTQTENTEIASLLASFLVGFISAEFEQRVRDLIEARAGRSKDLYMTRFVKRASERLVRGPKIEQLTTILQLFDDKCPRNFHQNSGDSAQAAYNNIIEGRHAFVHGGHYNLTMKDVEDWFHASAGVFSGLVAALGLTQSEIKHLA
jgi:hypothetical protein